MKKVLTVTDSLNIGGLETVVVNYLKYTNRDDYHFTFLIFDKFGKVDLEDEIKLNGGEILRVKAPKENYINFYYNLKKILKDYGPFDVVHSHPLFTNGIVMKAARSQNIPKRISHSHTNKMNVKESIIKRVYNKFMRRLIKNNATDYIAVSKESGAYLYGKTFFKKKGIILENGVDLERFQYNSNVRNEVRQKYNLKGKTVVGHVGTFNKVKNQEFLIKIINELAKLNNSYVLMLVGDGPTQQKIKSKVELLKLEDNVIFLGKKNNINKLLQGMDLFVFPSLFEGLGISVIEAQAAKLPCLVSDKIPDEALVTDYVKKISLNKSPKDWVNEILKFERYNRQACNVNALFESNYQMDKSIEKLTKIYESK